MAKIGFLRREAHQRTEGQQRVTCIESKGSCWLYDHLSVSCQFRRNQGSGSKPSLKSFPGKVSIALSGDKSRVPRALILSLT
jgi:hypothetical protein